MSAIVKKIVNIKHHKIDDFSNLITEQDLFDYFKNNQILIDKSSQNEIYTSACPLEFYIKNDSEQKSTTIVIDINGFLIGYNNGEHGNLGDMKNL